MKYTEKDLIMMYHTTLRNMGLYTSLSMALLGYSRYYRGRGSMVYNVCFIIFSLIASSIYVINDIVDVESDKKHPYKKYRPLAAGIINIDQCKILIFFLLFLDSSPLSYQKIQNYIFQMF